MTESGFKPKGSGYEVCALTASRYMGEEIHTSFHMLQDTGSLWTGQVKSPYSFIYSLIQLIFTEHLLCVRLRGNRSEQFK